MSRQTLNMPAPPQGVVASLVAGFETVNTRLELLLLPLALDLLLWLGPRWSIQPLVQQLAGAVVTPPGADAATRSNVELIRAALQEYGESFNLLSLLSTAPLGLPSLLSGRSPAATPLGAPTVYAVDSLALYVLLLGSLSLVGLLLGAFYLGCIAQQVRDRRISWLRLLREVWADWARLTALAVVLLVVLILLGTPVVLLTGVSTLIHPVLGGFVWIAGATLILWTIFYGAFAVHGMLLKRRGLFGALWDSARLVQVNLPQTAALLVIVVLVNAGLALVWNIPADNSWLLLLGMAGHALIYTVLIAATFAFYQDRYRWWTEMRHALRARSEAEQRSAEPKA